MVIDRLAQFGGRKWLLVALLAAFALLLLLAGFATTRPTDSRPKPPLGLMTTLPLVWSEGGIEADLAKDAAPHPAFTRLSVHYDITPIDDLETWASRPKHMLLLAQPRAFAPRELASIDNWVRQGGLVLILADPALQWGSLYPLGDKRRPLFTSMLSPLLNYWGVELVLPLEDEGPASMRKIGVFNIRTVTPGEWLPKQSTAKNRCAILAKGLLADCRIGTGRAILVADADFLDAAFWEGRGMRILTGKDEFANIALLQALLTALQGNKGLDGDFVGK
ncbi:MAG: hypothetical protein HEQ34_06930 [Sphingorhabdus sp.]|uniref:Gldg family protein n=1 Tax=Sphingorhabdus sp. TaxID=1902408 RepID=UPI0025FF421A|nr:hypothetical protein [Sphingorhabdus sp.]MCO4091672.1 hypothetical protein [Sphingorhabdus sp.]